MAAELARLSETGTIRVLDILILAKNEDGSVDALEIDDSPAVDEIRALERDIAEILAAEDVELLAEAMLPGSVAGVLVYENSWAAPFADVARRAGAQLVATGRIPIQAIAASIEAEHSDEEEADMPLRSARAARRGVIGSPVARTAATVGTAAVVVHGVRRRGDRREDRRDDRRDRRR